MSWDTVAHFVTNRRRWVVSCAAILVVLSALQIIFGLHFASDVLDLLPNRFDAVKTFKVFDREFSQARELTFALYDESGEADLDAFTEHFADQLRAEPWVLRVMDRSPIESTGGMEDVQMLAVPLLLNLDDASFDNAIAALQPANIEARLQKLRNELEAGSPKAEFQLGFDPLGLIGPALKPLAGSFSVEQTRPLSSPDGKLRIVLAFTNQTDLGAHACQDTMRKVEVLKQRVLASWKGPAPKILATGRTAYVGELSIKMRNDVGWTLITSAVLVSLVFIAGFRRIRPLFAIMHVLLLCCVIAIALGGLVFGELNMITIGLCSILIGLGVDFGMMLYAVYQAERDAGLDHERAISAALGHQGKGVFFGSLTTAAAFFSLLLSECGGFMQLGTLIAFGILVCGVFMMSVFFVFVGKKHQPHTSCAIRIFGGRFVAFLYRHSKAVFLGTTALLSLLTVLAAAPLGRIQFEANPRTLEPKNSLAGDALRTIQAKMPSVGEPVIVYVEASSAEEFHQRWTALNAHWRSDQVAPFFKTDNNPAAFAIAPERLQKNATKLASVNIASARTALTATIEREGLQTSAFSNAFALLDALERLPKDGVDRLINWRKLLPQNSIWWFVLDRFYAQNSWNGAAYLVPAKPIKTREDHRTITEALQVPGIPIHVSGWTYTLAELGPWAMKKMVLLCSVMIVFNILLLLFLYRAIFPLVILFGGLFLSIGAMLTTLKFAGIPLNLFNVLAFPLVLGVGVDYGIYVVIAMRTQDPRRELTTVIKPVLLSGLTAIAGFGSLVTAENPALRSLGSVCAIGISWCLLATFLFVMPAYIWRGTK